MLQEVALGDRSLADYTHLVGRGLIDEIRGLAEPLAGKRVLHVSATAFGGGVSEILYTMVPLMRDVGLDAHWRVILGREEFFNVTKLMHNSLQGDSQTISDQQWEVFEAYNAMNAQSLDDEWDTIIVHDPQPAALRANASKRARLWIWRCHIDMSTPNPETVAHLLPLLDQYDTTVWHLQEYVPSGLDAYLWLRKHGFHGRIVFLTGHAGSHPLVVEASRLGDADVVAKPISAEVLRSLLEVSHAPQGDHL